MESFKEGVMVVVIPLLVEKELWGPFDRAVVVDCDVDTQIKRLLKGRILIMQKHRPC